MSLTYGRKNDGRQLYVVVRHRGDPHQPVINSWLDDDRLHAITTTPEVARLCREAQQRGERVCIHRCGWSDLIATICCSVAVDRFEYVDKWTSLVGFVDQQVLGAFPEVIPGPGQNSYFAPASVVS